LNKHWFLSLAGARRIAEAVAPARAPPGLLEARRADAEWLAALFP
jgi:hypothetical protein